MKKQSTTKKEALAKSANIRDVQERLGRKSVETTMGYIQPDASRIPSVL